MAGPMQTVVGRCRTASATFTRPANTTQYTAGEVVGDGSVMTFNRVLNESLVSTVIQEAICVDGANQSTKPDLELWLFDTTVTADADNAAFTPTDTELLTLVRVISFPSTSFKVGDATSGAGGNCVCIAENLGIPVRQSRVTELYGVLVARNAYTPTSDEVFTVQLQLLD